MIVLVSSTKDGKQQGSTRLFLKKEHYAERYCSQPAADDVAVTLFDGHLVPFAQAPLDTKTGNWYLETSVRSKDDLEAGAMTGLIVRDSGLPQYTIIGVADKWDYHSKWYLEGIDRPDDFEIC